MTTYPPYERLPLISVEIGWYWLELKRAIVTDAGGQQWECPLSPVLASEDRARQHWENGEEFYPYSREKDVYLWKWTQAPGPNGKWVVVEVGHE